MNDAAKMMEWGEKALGFKPDDLNTLTMLSNVMSNNVDAALRQAFTLDTGLTAKEQWADRGEGTVIFSPVNERRRTTTRLSVSIVTTSRSLLSAGAASSTTTTAPSRDTIRAVHFG